MTIQEWLDKGGDYRTGVALYGQSRFANRRLLRLFERSHRPVELRMELKKVAAKEKIFRRHLATKPVEEPAAKPDERYFPQVRLADLPKQLHADFIRQKECFYKAAALKSRLNELPDEETELALRIIRKIMDCFALIDHVWRKIDRWREKGDVVKVDVAGIERMTPVALVKRRQLLYQRISKRKKTLEKLRRELAGAKEPRAAQRLTAKLERKEKELAGLEEEVFLISQKLKTDE